MYILYVYPNTLYMKQNKNSCLQNKSPAVVFHAPIRQ